MKKNIKKLLLVGILALSTAIVGCVSQTKDDDSITIYFARHGKTIFNTYDLVQGWADSPLTDQGIEVAKYLGEGLKNIDFDGYYSSDAGRQRETMQVILEQKGVRDYKIIELKGLREVFFGGFEGGSNAAMGQAVAKELGYSSGKAFFNDMKAGKIGTEDIDAIAKTDPKQQAENSTQVKQRTQAALKIMVDNALKNGQRTILAISSGSAMKIMISDLTDDLAKNLPLSNAAIVKITYKNGNYIISEIGSMDYVNKGKLTLSEK